MQIVVNYTQDGKGNWDTIVSIEISGSRIEVENALRNIRVLEQEGKTTNFFSSEPKITRPSRLGSLFCLTRPHSLKIALNPINKTTAAALLDEVMKVIGVSQRDVTYNVVAASTTTTPATTVDDVFIEAASPGMLRGIKEGRESRGRSLSA